jgi:hypothetical protein
MEPELRTLLAAIVFGKIRKTSRCRPIPSEVRSTHPSTWLQIDIDLLEDAEIQFVEGWKSVDQDYIRYR